jgi:iron complex outermembrane receptor protein
LRADSYAGYAQLEVPVVTRLRATVGARYSREHKSIDAQLVRLDPDSLRLTDVVVATGAQGGSWNALTWRAGLEFQADESSMLYLSASRGYKSGGFNVRLNERLPNLGLTPFAPETALTAEAGLRSEWLGRRLRVNATAFDTDYRDVQLRQQTVVGGVGTTVIENAARARIRGIEAEITAQVTDRLAARLAFGHLHARYLDVGRVPGLTRATRLQRTPSDSLAAAADYVVPLRSGALALHVDWTWRSREQFQLTPTPWDQGAYGMWRGRLGLHSQSGLSIALFGTNLADVRYRTAGRATLLSQTGIAYSSVGLPRQFGVEITLTR